MVAEEAVTTMVTEVVHIITTETVTAEILSLVLRPEKDIRTANVRVVITETARMAALTVETDRAALIAEMDRVASTVETDRAALTVEMVRVALIVETDRADSVAHVRPDLLLLPLQFLQNSFLQRNSSLRVRSRFIIEKIKKISLTKKNFIRTRRRLLP